MEIRKNQPISSYLWITPIDSEAKYFYEPKSIEELSKFNYSYDRVLVLGAGSNVIIGKFNGLVIRTNRLNKIKIEENEIIVESGVLNRILVTKCIKEGLGGFEFLYTIPGAIGGAVFMNAGAHGGCTSEVVKWVEVVDYNGKMIRLNRNEINFGYRHSSIKADQIITRVAIAAQKINPKESIMKIREIDLYVNRVQPRSLTAGSTFKNPEGMAAWQLIQELNPEDLKSKNCHFSGLHSNFLINNGQATARELYELALSVQSKVEQLRGVKLEFEVKFFLN